MLRAMFAVALFYGPACGQSFRPEVFAGIAYGRLFRFDDNPLGSGANLGAGVGVTHRSGLGADLEVNRMFGLSAAPAACGVLNVICMGSARAGVTGATIVSFNVRYEFAGERVRPYVTGGVGALESKGYSASLLVFGQRATWSEDAWTDTGLAVSFGAGLRIRVSRGLSLRPEVRLYTAGALSRANLGLVRPSLALSWSW